MGTTKRQVKLPEGFEVESLPEGFEVETNPLLQAAQQAKEQFMGRALRTMQPEEGATSLGEAILTPSPRILQMMESAENVRGKTISLASRLPEPLRGPAAAAATFPISAGKSALGFLSPLGVSTLGLGPAVQGLRTLGAPAAVTGTLGAAETGLGLGLGAHGAGQALQPARPGETQADILERRLGGAAAAFGGGTAALHGARPAIKGMGERIVGIQRSVQEGIAARNKEFSEAKAKYDTALAETTRKRAEVGVETELRTLGEKQKVEKTNAELTKRYDEAVAARDKLLNEQRGAVIERQRIEAQVKKDATAFGTQLKQAEKTIRTEISGRFEKVNQVIGDQPVKGEVLQKAIREATDRYIKGSEENIRIFKEIMEATGAESALLGEASVFRGAGQAGRAPSGSLGEALSSRFMTPEVAARIREQIPEAVIAPKAGQISVKDAQGFSTELGNRIAQGNLPGDVYQAMKYVQERVQGEVQRVASESTVKIDNAALGDYYKTARGDWHKMMKTFHDTTPLTEGGSAVARAFRANPEDAGFVLAPFKTAAGTRGVKLLEQYPKHIDANMARRLLENSEIVRALPTKVKVPPEIRPPTLKEFAPPKGKAGPELPEEPVPMRRLEAQAVKKEAVNKLARKLKTETSTWEVGIPGLGWAHLGVKRIVGAFLDSPYVKNRLSEPTRRELRKALQQMEQETQ